MWFNKEFKVFVNFEVKCWMFVDFVKEDCFFFDMFFNDGYFVI